MKGVFLSVFNVLNVLKPVAFFVIGEGSMGFNYLYFVFIFEYDEDGKMVEV